MLASSISYAKDLLSEGYEYSGFEIASVVYDSVYGEDSGASMEKKFVDKFHRGFIDRPTVKEALPTRTVPDYSTDSILYALIPSLDETMLSLIRISHKISMAADSIIGTMLDEYIHDRLRPYGWTCCWGNSMQGIDFCSKEGLLLHVRNKSNTEVSANAKNRIRNKVIKWFRLNAYTGNTKWEDLNLIVGKSGLFSEEDFKNFTFDTIKNNPHCLYTGEEEAKRLSTLVEGYVQR